VSRSKAFARIMRGRVQPYDFYARNTIAVARDLLGQVLVHDSPDGVSAGVIIETEAYCGVLDRACHAFGRRRTRRTRVMYEPAGTVYVYLIYGLHHCLNVVTLGHDWPQAVLIRSLEPLEGLQLMAARRGVVPLVGGAPNRELANGPGKLTQAMGIDLAHNGTSLVEGPLYISEGERGGADIAAGPRVGVSYSQEFSSIPWNFRFVSPAHLGNP